jgi:hypothetical protein
VKTSLTIAELIKTSDRNPVGRELTLEELEFVFGGSGGGVPSNTPQSGEYDAGRAQAQSGHDLFVTGTGVLLGASALPPPADVLVGGVGAYQMVEGAGRMDQGEAMMDHAQAQYDASQVTPPPTVVTIETVVITATPEGTYHQDGGDVMVMDPLVVTPGGGDGGDY